MSFIETLFDTDDEIVSKEEKFKIAKRRFVERVEEIGGKTGDYIDAIVRVCEEEGIDEMTAAAFTRGTLRKLVEHEAMSKNLLKDKLDVVELPFDGV